MHVICNQYVIRMYLESDNEDQGNINGAPNFGVQDDGIIDMHNINIMVFPGEVIRNLNPD